VLKVLADRTSDEVHVHASHILFSVDGSQDSSAVKASALNVAKLAKSGADFAELAKRHSKDPGSAERGGDLGWFGKGRMVKSFEDAAFSARPGQIVGPIRSQFGWHIIKVHERDSREIKIVDIVIPISISTRTKNDVYQRAADFAYNARENDFLREAQSFDFEVREATLREKAAVISGLGSNESAARWAFDNDVGEVSEPFSFTTGYAVFLIIEAKEAGVRPFEEAKEGLVPAARRELKIKRAMEIAAEHLGKLSPSDSLTKLQQTDPSISVKRAGPVTLAASIPGIGRDQNVFGALSGLSPGKISKPVESTRGGAYLLQLLSRTAFDSTAYRNQRETLRTQLLQERRARRMNEWIAKLKETADIEDNRDQFFR
jgi:parvulin-like peptidyl-prolyl isomerase